MKIIYLTRGFSCIVDDSDYGELSRYRWHYSNGYARRCIKNGGRGKALKMHRQIIKVPSGYQIDHINHNKLDNRRENLRICTAGENQRNRLITTSNRSGYKGVCWSKDSHKWQAQIKVNRKMTYLGMFSDVKDAAIAYNQAAIRLHGDFAVLNVIDIK